MTGDLVVPPGPGLPQGLVIPAEELSERFSRASGPGGQGVNTTDSRVQLSFDVTTATSLTADQRARVLHQERNPGLPGTLRAGGGLEGSSARSMLHARGYEEARRRLVGEALAGGGVAAWAERRAGELDRVRAAVRETLDGATEVGKHHDRGIRVERRLDRRKGRLDALLGGDAPVLDRYVQILTDQHAFAGEIEISHAQEIHGGLRGSKWVSPIA